MFFFFFFNDTATTEIYTLSLHDALPIFPAPFCIALQVVVPGVVCTGVGSDLHGDAAGRQLVVEITMPSRHQRSEEHTSELQSRLHLVCRLLLEKKKKESRRWRCVTSIAR